MVSKNTAWPAQSVIHILASTRYLIDLVFKSFLDHNLYPKTALFTILLSSQPCNKEKSKLLVCGLKFVASIKEFPISKITTQTYQYTWNHLQNNQCYIYTWMIRECWYISHLHRKVIRDIHRHLSNNDCKINKSIIKQSRSTCCWWVLFVGKLI